MLHFTHSIPDGGVAVWNIEEDESELAALLTASGSCMADDYAEIFASWRSEGRRKEWLAVRILVARCLGADCRIAYLPSGRPYVADGSFRISISHTKGFAAIVWHLRNAVGIDIEQRSERVMRVRSKFVNAAEQELASTVEGALCIWCAKETVYKILDTPSIDLQQEVTVTATPVPASPSSSSVSASPSATAVPSSSSVPVPGHSVAGSLVVAVAAAADGQPSLQLPMAVVSEPQFLLVWAVCP